MPTHSHTHGTEASPLWLSVPFLHPDDALRDAPNGARACWPGQAVPQTQDPTRLWQPALPYSPEEAAQCLRDLRAMGRERPTMSREDGAQGRGLTDDERASLTAFCAEPATGTDSATPASDAPSLARTRQAQRCLLMAWVQEEHVREIRALLERCRVEAAALASQLDEPALPQDADASDALDVQRFWKQANEHAAALTRALEGILPEDAETFLPPWRFVLEHMAPFLPAEAVLWTTDPRMIGDLAESGLLPPPCNLEEAGFAGLSGEGRVVRAPLWRVLDRRSASPDAPWLDTIPTLVCRTEI